MNTKRIIFILCSLMFGVVSAYSQGNTLTIPDVTVAPGRSISLPIQMNNTSEVVGVQFTLTLPDGITIDPSTAALSERSDGHDFRVSEITKGEYLAVIYSTNNKPFIGRYGTLLTVTLTASQSLEEGFVRPLALTDVVLGASDGTNIATGFTAGKVICAKSPDLEVSNVGFIESAIAPNGKLSASWQVSNIGGVATGDGWAEHILLETAKGTVKEIAILYYDQKLNAGGTVSRNAEINVPFILGLSEDAYIRVKVVPNRDTGEPVGLQTNNSSFSSSKISVGKAIRMTPDSVETDEAKEQLLSFMLERSGDTSSDESFVVEKIDDTRLSLPETITIPKGQSGVKFYAQVKANQKMDNQSVANLIVTGTGYDSVTSLLSINDDILPTLGINTETQDVIEGGTIKFRISTERASDSDILVSMTCDMAKRFEIPSDIKIEAGKKEVEVVVKALEDDIPNAEEAVSFSVTAARHNPASTFIVLVDNDVPTLQLSISPTAISEAAGPLSLTAKLRRIDNVDKVVTVKLSDDSNGGIYYGRQTITLDKGVEEVTVNLGPIDNAIVDGERTINISAAVWIASCSCNANNATSGGVVSVPVTVYDNDGPTLTLSTTTSVLNEGKEMTVTVKRNTSTSESLTVNLSSDHDASFEYPKSVTIPTGKSEVSFTIKSIGNETTGDGFTAIFTATSDGYATGNIWFAVSDQNLPDAQITDISISSNEVEAGGTVVVETTVSNTGSYELPELTKVGIYLSNSSSPIATLYLQKGLPVGETVVLKKEIQLPSSVGTFKVYAIVNDGNEVKELCNTNNSSIMLAVKTVSPYSVNILSDKTVYKPGDDILISGNITGTDVSGKEVEIYVINNSYRHVIKTNTDESGNFSCNYIPFPGQLGKFDVGACYPGELISTCMVSFEIIGIKRTSNKAITFEPIVGEQNYGSFEIANYSSSQLTNVKAEIISQPENINITINCPSIIEANGRFNLEYAVDATSPSIGNDWEKIILNITSAEGASLQTTLYCYSRNKTGKLKASINRIKSTMNIETPRDYNFVISNIGKGETGGVTLELPSWMTYVTPKEIPSLQSGDSISVSIRFTPASNMQINVPVTGSIGLNCANGEGLSIPYYIEPVSESTGILTIDVCDEFTYYTSEAPHVSGASVMVKHPTTGEVLAEGKTGADGIYGIELPEGYYTVAVSADKHQSYTNNIYLNPGQDNKIVVNLGYTAITYNWEVVETEVEDEYSISTRVVYETNVPVPCVVIKMPEKIDGDNMAINESTVILVTLTNKGLVTALNVTLEMPENTDEWVFEPLSSIEPFDLPAMQSVTVPVQITRIANGNYRTNAKAVTRANIVENFNNCMAVVAADYEALCGEDIKNNKAVERMAMKMCATAATGATLLQFVSQYIPGGSGGPGGPGGPSGPGGDGDHYHNPETDTHPITTGHTFNLCDTCDANRAEAIIDFLIGKTFLAPINDGMNIAANSAQEMRENGGQDVVRRRLTQSAFERLREELNQQRRERVLGEHGAEAVGWVEDIIEIIDIITQECPTPSEDPETAKAKRLAKTTTRSWQEEYFHVARRTADYLRNYDAFLLYFFGDRMWYEGNLDEMDDMFTLLCKGEDVTLEQVLAVKPQFATDEQVKKLYKRILGGENGYEGPDNIDWDKVEEYANISNAIDEQSIIEGYPSLADQYQQAYDTCVEGFNGISQSVCASITLQFSQKMTMTRQAFRGTLTVFNGHETEAMRDVKLTLEVKDEDGNVATSHEFQINPEKLIGFDGELDLSSGWTLDAGQTGVSTILFIPTKYAAPTVEKRYAFGGTLSYVDPFTGLTVTRTLAPVTLTVKPSPNLDLTYFMQRDIKGDDPLTLDVVEPCEEAEFSLLINNKGYGDATNVKMVTDQPKIIENEKGLHVDFELMSSQLNGEDKTLALGGSVTTDFGTIPAMSTAYAQWWIKSSLLGHFTDYNVEATHVTSYDNPDLSLLNEVTIHELIRSVDASTAQKNLVGFMVNDIVDAEDTPDMMYLSDGEIESVSNVKNAVLNRTDKTTYTLTINPTASGWNYGNVIDPTYGLSEIKRVVRNSDGKEIALRNFWQTDRTLRDGKDPLYENRIHFVDNLATVDSETYTLTFEPLPDLLLAVASIEGVPGDGSLSVEPLKSLNVMFNKAIDPKTFTTDDITLAVQGVKQDVLKVSISTKDNKTFNIDFSQINETIGNGYFVFTVQTSEIVDNEGFNGKVGKSASWIMFRDGFVTLNTETYPKSAGSILRSPVNAASRAAEVSEVAENKAEYGSLIKMESVANDGYDFKNWTLNGEVISTEPILEYQALDDVDIVANFSLKNYSIFVDYDAEGGNVSGSSSGYYTKGTELTFSAQAYEDWVFEGWTVNGESAGNDETLTVVIDGTTAVKALFRHDIYHQDYILEKGWNWISTYLNDPIPVDVILGGITRILCQTEEVINDPELGLVGNIKNIQPGEAYKVQSSQVMFRTSTGRLHSLDANPMIVKKGWNWISYPYSEERSVDAVISNPDQGEFLVAQEGFIEYTDGKWQGTLDVMKPSVGYLYKSVKDKTLVFDFSVLENNSTAKSRSFANATNMYEYIDVRKYPNTMNIIAEIQRDGYNIEYGYHVYAMVDDECRGVGKFINGRCYITVYGEKPEPVVFVVKNATGDVVLQISESLLFKSDVIGSTRSPFKMTILDATGISYNTSLKSDFKSIHNILGQKVKSIVPGGVYIIDGQKIVVTKKNVNNYAK